MIELNYNFKKGATARLTTFTVLKCIIKERKSIPAGRPGFEPTQTTLTVSPSNMKRHGTIISLSFLHDSSKRVSGQHCQHNQENARKWNRSFTTVFHFNQVDGMVIMKDRV